MIFIHLISAKDILDKERRHRDAKCSLTEVVHTVSIKDYSGLLLTSSEHLLSSLILN